MNRLQQIIWAILISWNIFFLGVAGYMIIEHWNFLDAAYMTALTVTTVGFMEVHETSATGKIFTIFVMIAGVGYFLYITGMIIQAVVEGEVQILLGRLEDVLEN